MNTIRQRLDNDKFARHVGIQLLQIAPGQATATLDITREHLNGIDVVQGGALFTLADYAFAAAANSRGHIAVAINATITFLKSVSEGTLTATAEELSKSSKLSTYRVTVTDDADEPVAVFQGTAYRKSEEISNQGTTAEATT
jgi:acyl-CoA thioesterase